MELKKFIPLPIRKFFLKSYAIRMFEDACRKADEAHNADPEGHRYYVLPVKGGNLKVTTADEETRARRNVKTLDYRNVRKPYRLRRQSFYFTESKVCKPKFQPQGMQPFEREESRKKFIEWYFQHH